MKDGGNSSNIVTVPRGGPVVGSLVQTLARRDTLSAREQAALEAAVSDIKVAPAGTTLVRAHNIVENSTLLVEGFIARLYYLASGKRQIVAIHVPGDFVDLHSLLLKELDHDVVALTDVRIAHVPHAALRRITETEPHLTRMLWFLTAADAAIHREWTAALGHSAAGRIAHRFCELQVRLAIVGRADPAGYALPLTQADLADMTGLTAVHVNRTLRQLREAGLMTFRDGRVIIPDLARLQAFASFDPLYLYTETMPR